jgi:hypothetical protein
LYSPLILLYQSVMAPSIRTVQPDGSSPGPLRTFPERHQLHPLSQREIPDAERSLNLTWEQIAAKFREGR